MTTFLQILTGPDLLFIVTWLVGMVGVVTSLIALNGALRHGWNAERTLVWMAPVALSQLMDHYGWWPVLAMPVLAAGIWLWNAVDDRLKARSTVKG